MTYIPTKLKHEITIDSIITIHYFEYMKNFVFQGESHNFWEFLYVDNGMIMVQADDNWYTLHSGDIIFHRPNEFHSIRSIGKESPNLVVISFTSSSPAMEFFEHKIYTLTKEERLLISKIIEEASLTFSTPLHIPSVEQVKLAENSPFASQQMILLYLEQFLIQIYRESLSPNNQSIIKFKSSLEPEKQNRITDIIQYMQLHICERLTISQICNTFFIGRSTLQKLFHESVNCGAMDYFNHLKIQRAKEIIRSDAMTLTEIAYYLSYSSLAYFSKRFKKELGMSPMAYHNSIKKISDHLTDKY